MIRRPLVLAALAAVVATVLPLIAPAALAQEVGRAQRVVNTVYGGGLLYRLQTGQPVVFNERISTAEASATSIALGDGSFLELGPQAEVTLDRFVVDSRSGVTGVVRMTRGALRFAGTPVPKRIDIETPSASIGIRGTILSVRVTAASTEVEVTEGTVTITAAGQVLQASAGQFVLVDGPARPLVRQPTPAFRQEMQRVSSLLGPIPVVRAAAPTAPNPSGTEPVMDASGRLLGTLGRRADGMLEVRDLTGRLRGYVDPVRNQTLDASARVIGPGNLAPTLLGGR